MEVAEPWVDCLLEEYFMQVSPAGGSGTQQVQQTNALCVCVSERPREGRGASCGSVHGQGKGHQAHSSDRLHQVCAHPNV